jgi:ligand-binding sensor domain-containing protein
MSKFAAAIIAISLMILTAADCAGAQDWRRFATADGLADNTVDTMLEDRHGNLWFGTDNGLSQFNGLFTTHLSGMSIRSLLESQDGTIWAGTYENGLRSYDGSGWQEHMSGMSIASLLESQDGTIWAGTYDNGLHSYDGSGWQEHMSGMDVRCLLESRDGTIWAGSNGLHSYDSRRWQEHMSGMEVYSLLESQDGTIWAGTYENGLRSYDGSRWQQHLIRTRVYSLLESQDGIIWAGTDWGLHSYDGSGWQQHMSGMGITSLLESQDDTIWAGNWNGLHSYDGKGWQEHMSGMSIQSLLESQDGTIWAGTYGDGLHRYDSSRRQEHLSGTRVGLLLESQDGIIWAGTYRDGLHSYDGTSWQEHLSGMRVLSLLESQDGTIWAGTDWGLHSYDGSGWQEHLSGMGITSLLESQDGTIWAGTSVRTETGWKGDGLHSYDSRGWQEHLSGMEVYSLLESQDGTIWAGTIENGLHSYDGSGWQEHLSGMIIYSLLESQDGAIWARTYGDGLHSYDGSGWQERLSGMGIWSLLESQDGAIWAGTDWGLHRYDGSGWQEHLSGMGVQCLLESQDGTIWAGTYGDGLHSYDGSRWQEHLSGTRVYPLLESQDGTIWAGISSGIVAFKPDRDPPSIEITEPQEAEVIIGDSSLFVAWRAGDIETETRLLAYEFRIGEEEWKPISGNSMMTPIMEDGDHTFNVRAIDGFSNYGEPDSLQITVDTIPPNVLISDPVEGAVVGSTVKIMGGVTDTDLAGFQVGYAEGEASLDSEYKLIGEHTAMVEFGQLAELDTSDLEEGIYTIRVRATDQLGHTRDDTVTVTFDNTKPVARINTPTLNQRLREKTVIEGEVEDAHMAEYTMEIIQNSQAKWSETIEISESQLTERKDIDTSAIYGNATVRITAVDKAGNESDAADVEVFFDNEGARPTARLESPGTDDVVAGTFEIMGEARSVGVFRRYNVRYAIGHEPSESGWVDISESSNATAERLATWDTTGLDDGEYSIWLTATDENDYTSEQIVRVVIDNTEPAIELESPADGGIETGEVLIKGTVMDNNFANYMVEFAPGINPGTEWEQLGEISESGTIERTWRTDGLDGLYSLRITASDKAIPVPNQTTLVRTITLDNTVAEAMIISPQEDQVIKDTIEIIGIANDDNFSDYQIFWGAEDDPVTDMITTPVINGILASWDTAGLDGIYAIRLVAHDKSQHEAIHSVSVVVDNTDPTAEITSPQNYDQVGGVVELRGTATDDNFGEYTVEYGEGPSPQAWTLASEVARYTTSVTKGKLFDWFTGDKVEIFTLRVTVKDAVEHEKQASVIVDVMPPVKSQEGGKRTSTDGLAALYLSPRSLPEDTVITINSILSDEIQAPPDTVMSLNLAYDIGPSGLEFSPIKPATLQIRLGSKPAGNQKRIALFRWDTSEWVLLGGTVQEDKLTVGITQTGHYALMETDIDVVDLSEVGSLFTCQPRVFSPNQGQTTNISFSLQEEASVTLKIYNIDGRLQKTLVSGSMYAGRNAVLWDGKNEDSEIVPSGLYIITLESEEERVETKTVIVENR